jgi:hypothetical protein
MEQPYFVLIELSQGFYEAVILIRGYFSEDSFTIKMEEDWKKAVRQSEWKGAIYHIWWESSID